MASTVVSALSNRPKWHAVLIVLVMVLLALGVGFYATLSSLVSTWSHSDTYAHGFLILPISLWLIWEKRAGLIGSVPQPTLLPALLMIPVGGLWFVAHLVDVLIIQQYAFVGLLILAVWALVGTPVARYLAFPIGFLLLAVPVGEELTYPMMNFTADFAVRLLRITGIPVYRDGTFFSLPSGDWSVVEDCSGIRYLLASITLGVLFAYLTYSTLWKRLAFVAFSVVVPVVANGLRAYIIVMLGHLSGMRLAVGIDHVIYGWAFFGIVIAIMFAIGAIWREPVNDVPPGAGTAGVGRGMLGVALATVVAGICWPGLLWVLERPAGSAGAVVELRAPPPAPGWSIAAEDLWTWRPHLGTADGEFRGFYRSADGPVGVFLGVYRGQGQGAELVNFRNQMVSTQDEAWSDKETTTRTIRLPTGEFSVKQSRLAARNGALRLLVWNWYRIGDVNTGNPYLAKLLEAVSRLTGTGRAGSLVAVAAPYHDNEQEAASLLDGFLRAMMPAIEAELARAVAPPS